MIDGSVSDAHGIDWPEFAKHVRLVAQPIDFHEMTANGLLRKVGAWYEVRNIHELPKHARLKIREIKVRDKKTMVKFTAGGAAVNLVKQLEKLGY